MSSDKPTADSHRYLTYANPISEAKIESLIELFHLSATSQVLEVGAGSAELLIRLIERYGVKAVGIDNDPYVIDKARQRAAARVAEDRLELLQIEGAEFQAPPESFDLAVCIGATHAFGDYASTLTALNQFVRKGGLMLVGELFWKKEPEEAYLAEFGVASTEYTSHVGNIATGINQGLTPLFALAANEDEWDHYEWTRIYTLEQYAKEQPDDPEVPELIPRIRAWRDIYLRWGRDTLGFGLYLFEK